MVLSGGAFQERRAEVLVTFETLKPEGMKEAGRVWVVRVTEREGLVALLPLVSLATAVRE